jgi:hypothetical protein
VSRQPAQRPEDGDVEELPDHVSGQGSDVEAQRPPEHRLELIAGHGGFRAGGQRDRQVDDGEHEHGGGEAHDGEPPRASVP